jgi:hypothetical protein
MRGLLSVATGRWDLGPGWWMRGAEVTGGIVAWERAS